MTLGKAYDKNCESFVQSIASLRIKLGLPSLPLPFHTMPSHAMPQEPPHSSSLMSLIFRSPLLIFSSLLPACPLPSSRLPDVPAHVRTVHGTLVAGHPWGGFFFRVYLLPR